MSLRSRDYSSTASGPLTDEAIFAYCLSGHYGEAKQKWAKEELKRVRLAKLYAKRTPQEVKAQTILNELGL